MEIRETDRGYNAEPKPCASRCSNHAVLGEIVRRIVSVATMYEVRTIQDLPSQIRGAEILLPEFSAATCGTATRCGR